MVGSIKRRTSRGKMIRRRNTVSILEGEENRKKEVRIVAVLTDSNDVVSWSMFCGLVGWGVLSDAKCKCLLKILAVENILLLQFCNKFGLGG